MDERTMFNGALLKELRQRKGMSQEELGQACHMSQSAISLWERGNREPDMDALKTLSRYFNIPSDLFLITHDKDSFAIAATPALAFGESDVHPITEAVKEALTPLEFDDAYMDPLLRYADYLAKQTDKEHAEQSKEK